MTARTLPLKRRAAWKKLQAHFKVIGPRHLRELFAEDPGWQMGRTCSRIPTDPCS